MLISEQQLENTAFLPVNVPQELGLSGSDFRYNVLVFDDVIELDTSTGDIAVRSGLTLDREVQSEHILDFNVRDVSTNACQSQIQIVSESMRNDQAC